MRSRIQFRQDDEVVLKLIMKGYSTNDIARKAKFSTSKVNNVRRILWKTLGAKSNVQLIVIAILDWQYFKYLGEIKHKRIELKDKDRNIILSMLKGKYNKEIAESFDISERAVEHTKGKFLKEFNYSGDIGLVKGCIEAGLLVIFPVSLKLKPFDLYGKEQKIYILKKHHIKKSLAIEAINPSGFLYVDFENRFTFQCIDHYIKPKKLCELLVTACSLSGFDEVILLNTLSANIVSLHERVMSVSHDIRLITHTELLQFYIHQGHLTLNINATKKRNALMAGQAVLVNFVAKGVPTNKIHKTLRTTKDVIDEQIDLLKIIWSASSVLSIYVTFLHLKFLTLDQE